MRRHRPAVEVAWLGYLTLGALLAAAYYLIPDRGGGAVLRVVLYCVVSASAAVVVFGGVARHRPRPVLPWLLIGAGQVVYAVADANFYLAHYLRRDLSYPAVADVFYLAHYPLVTAGLIILIRRRTPRRDVPGLLDAAALAVVAAMLSWVYLIAPQTQLSVPLLVKLTSLAYPVLDLALLAVAVRLILGGGHRPLAFFLLSGNLLAMLAADSLYVLQQLSGSYGAGNFLDAVWLLGNLLIGAAALHPTMRSLGEPAESPPDSLGLPRIAALCVAALIAPATLWIQDLRGELQEVPAIALACALLFVLTIARLVELVLQQRTLAITDALTGLRTRRFLEAQLPAELARVGRGGGALALFLIDVDHFKSVNDSHGHPAGDRALIEIARRLRAGSRAGDLLARYGGEEFALLTPDTCADELDAVAERLRRAVAQAPVLLSPHIAIELTVSIGAAGYPLHGRSPAGLVEAADRALYAAKQSGRNRIVVGRTHPRRRPVPDPDAVVEHLIQLAEQLDALQARQGHSRAVGHWSARLCTELGGAPDAVRRAELAGRLLGVAKIELPEPLPAAQPLSTEERRQLRAHPEHGSRLVGTVAVLPDVAEVIRQQHAHFDGGGDLRGLAGAQILLEARVVALCQAWAGLRAARPDRNPLPERQALAALRAGRGSRFDPNVVDTFLDLHSRGLIEPWQPPARHAVG